MENLFHQNFNTHIKIMNERSKASTKDNILKIMIESRHLSLKDISTKLKKDISLISYMVEELEKDGLVFLENITGAGDEIPRNYYVEITNKGIFFLNYDGGYTDVHKEYRKETVWKTTKIIASVLNAIAIILIGYFSL